MIRGPFLPAVMPALRYGEQSMLEGKLYICCCRKTPGTCFLVILLGGMVFGTRIHFSLDLFLILLSLRYIQGRSLESSRYEFRD